MSQSELKKKLANLPDSPGVYLMKDASSRILYVGKAVSIKNRVRSYFTNAHHAPRTASMVLRIDDVEFIITNTEKEALILESNLIKLHNPKYNVKFTDNSNYPYIRITREKFPSILVTRAVRKDEAKYFGPYTDAYAARKSVKALRRIFPIRSCVRKMPKLVRPCLNYQLKLCSGPCSGRIDPTIYAELVTGITKFLEGRQDDLIKDLTESMNGAASRTEFEVAAKIRDKIRALQSISEQQYVEPRTGDEDVLALAREDYMACALTLMVRDGKITGQRTFPIRGARDADVAEVLTAFVKQHYFHMEGAYIPSEIILPHDIDEAAGVEALLTELKGSSVKVRVPRRGTKLRLVNLAKRNAEAALTTPLAVDALYVLQEALGLSELPSRIEAFDVSNLGGAEATGAMAVFIDGIRKPSDYRRYTIKTVNAIDDYAMLKEVVGRRYLKGEPLPDLVLIDGGRGHISAVRAVVNDLGINVPIIGLAKREELVYVPGKSEPVDIPQTGLNLLMNIRDEAHNAALKHHRTLRSTKLLESDLDKIPGVGKKRKVELLKRFGSLEEIKGATVEEIRSIPMIDEKIARNIHHYLNGEIS
ncbi:MAG TPA: excinuclease ABC subunit UvrC [Candidatus Acidoferrales bacterium]|nr:excinuclease ABC subunit UvrC [Candidatus Acidoferrales bacterium]